MFKHFKIIGWFIKQSFMETLEYRTDFVVRTVVSNAWLVLDIIFLSALISNISTIGTWNLTQATIALGVYRMLAFFIWSWMLYSFALIPKIVNNGHLDLLLTKPVDSQVIVSFRKFIFIHVSSLIVGIVLVLRGVGQLNYIIPPERWLLFLWMFIVAIALIYGFYFLTISACLFTDRLENIYQLFTEAFYTASRYPKEIYIGFFRVMLTSVVPIALMVSVPAEAIFTDLSWQTIIWFHFLAIFFMISSRMLWQFGLKRYSSASS